MNLSNCSPKYRDKSALPAGVLEELGLYNISPCSLLTHTHAPRLSLRAFPHKLDLVVKFYSC